LPDNLKWFLNHYVYIIFAADACLDEDDVKMMVDCIRIDHVCAEACSALSQILATSYKDVQGLVDYCKKVCEKCAQECDKHDAQHCKDCAKACRECAEACATFKA